MNFLKKFGGAILTASSALTGFGPLLAPFIRLLPANVQKIETTIVSELGAIAGVVGTVEGMAAAVNAAAGATPLLNGAAKLAAARPFVAQIVHASELIAGKKPHDPALFDAGVDEITNGVVKVLNSLQG